MLPVRTVESPFVPVAIENSTSAITPSGVPWLGVKTNFNEL